MMKQTSILLSRFLRLSDNGNSPMAVLTSKGLAVSQAYGERLQAVEREWRQRFGRNVSVLRELLEELTRADPEPG